MRELVVTTGIILRMEFGLGIQSTNWTLRTGFIILIWVESNIVGHLAIWLAKLLIMVHLILHCLVVLG